MSRLQTKGQCQGIREEAMLHGRGMEAGGAEEDRVETT